ncbi:hypothetical protein [Sediminibacillus massiliensis]|uniref:hypothetical protein n=1 Tax=Sediminibacillus massiliensis TaxID=1926277 RepID=UPI000988633F|nr:hypothetical protein [Sediminibacillus massiliensis]
MKLKPRHKGEVYRPRAIVRKVKRGLPTKIEIGGRTYSFESKSLKNENKNLKEKVANLRKELERVGRA